MVVNFSCSPIRASCATKLVVEESANIDSATVE